MNSTVADRAAGEDRRANRAQTVPSNSVSRNVSSTEVGQYPAVLDRLTAALSLPTILPPFRLARRNNRPSLLGRTLLQLQQTQAVRSSDRAVSPIKEGTASHRDRRAFPRHESPSTVTVVLCGQQRSVSLSERDWLLRSSRLKGPLLDISMNGVAFILSEPIADDENLLLRVSNPHWNRQVETSAHVVRTAPVNDSQWKVFCQFYQKLKLEQIHDVGKHLFQSAVV